MNKNRNLFLVVSIVILISTGCGENGISKNDQVLFDSVITRVKLGKIRTDDESGITPSSGSVRLPQSATLPTDLQAASANGEIYVFRPFRNQLLVVFIKRRGKGFNMEGYLYTEKPLGPQETSKDAYGKNMITLGPIDLTLDKKINTNWYHVSYKLD